MNEILGTREGSRSVNADLEATAQQISRLIDKMAIRAESARNQELLGSVAADFKTTVVTSSVSFEDNDEDIDPDDITRIEVGFQGEELMFSAGYEGQGTDPENITKTFTVGAKDAHGAWKHVTGRVDGSGGFVYFLNTSEDLSPEANLATARHIAAVALSRAKSVLDSASC